MSDPFHIGQIIKRSEIHDQYGGNRRAGISPCSNYPYLFIVSVPSGQNHGYEDRWENEEIYSYTGQGKYGDMKLESNNLQLLEHKKNGKRVFLFVGTERSYVQFQGELEFFDADIFPSLDSDGKERMAIRFFLKRINKEIEYAIGFQKEVFTELYRKRKIDLDLITERQGLVTSRVGQGAYRKSILYRWKYKCAVTNYDRKEILIASHILPWKESNNIERLDVNNGILLSPTYDALFDQKFISFENSGKIILSKKLLKSNYQEIGITGKEAIQNLSHENLKYLEGHREFLL